MGNLLLVLLIFFIVLFYFWDILPRLDRGRRQALLAFAKWDYAHRGLWDMEQGIPENSIPSFERAIKQNVAIELDVHLTKDNRLVVIHDSNLKRLCGVDWIVEQKTFDELARLTILKTGCRIPLLGQVLRTVRGRVPLLIEIKCGLREISICSYLYKELEFYNGDYLIQSFNPFALRWFRRHARHVLIGQLAGNLNSVAGISIIEKVSSYMLFVNGISRPDFISYQLSAAGNLSVRINQLLYRTPVFVWTVSTMNEYRQARALFSSAIFEKFIP